MSSIPFKPMLPSLVSEIPSSADWIYETKFDGYRCIAKWTESNVTLLSRNGQNLNSVFPEVAERLISLTPSIRSCLPLVLDGELCILKSPYKATFEPLQKRGRLKNPEKIQYFSKLTPSTYVVFDMVHIRGETITDKPLFERKEMVNIVFDHLSDHLAENDRIALVPSHKESDQLWAHIKEENGEGIIAKVSGSTYDPGARTKKWVKIKNPQKGVFFITAYEKSNGFFHVAALQEGKPVLAGLFSHGISPKERESLILIMKKNKVTEDARFITVSPSICVELEYLEIYKNQLRHPRFVAFRFDVSWEECTWEKIFSRKY
ncbi:non-homologous end-joining DNA ligase [Fictibacillus enclensis]|uniref:non-homologous end-joining DNA ligase n=1 Tax=Fictibacillus enclensis TaxID=1017270 RepID=UPI0025A036F2|nr:non-homologous end-joining DNA ligase [Fictibacillus enclensis]MDM5198576.1 non-homologous end-joining DNA ligase [Fictibacillus enclensis]